MGQESPVMFPQQCFYFWGQVFVSQGPTQDGTKETCWKKNEMCVSWFFNLKLALFSVKKWAKKSFWAKMYLQIG